MCILRPEEISGVPHNIVKASIQGIATYPELLKRATALEKTVRQMAYLEPNKGGLASLALARLAAALKVKFDMQAQCRISDSSIRKGAPQTRGPPLALFINTEQKDLRAEFVNLSLTSACQPLYNMHVLCADIRECSWAARQAVWECGRRVGLPAG